MNKTDRILNLIENHDGYTPEEIDNIMADSEMRELYEQLSDISGALHASETPADEIVEEEWRRFEKRHFGLLRHSLWHQRRAAIITAIVVTSLAAVGMGIGIGISIHNRNDVVEISQEKKAPEADVTIAGTPTDSVMKTGIKEMSEQNERVEFENVSLETIIERIAESHGLEVMFITDKPKELHLFYIWNTSQPLEETIRQLNSFESFDISLNAQTIIIK